MKIKEPHLTTAYIALVFSALGWLSWGLLAIPGLIVAHTIKTKETATLVALKAAFRVGYSSIFIGLSSLTALFVKYTSFATSLHSGNNFGGDPAGVFQTSPLTTVDKPSVTQWAWTGGIFLITLITLILILPLIRKGYDSIQSAKILRANETR